MKPNPKTAAHVLAAMGAKPETTAQSKRAAGPTAGLAPHVRAAITSAAQPKAAPGSRAGMAAHVQATVSSGGCIQRAEESSLVTYDMLKQAGYGTVTLFFYVDDEHIATFQSGTGFGAHAEDNALAWIRGEAEDLKSVPDRGKVNLVGTTVRFVLTSSPCPKCTRLIEYFATNEMEAYGIEKLEIPVMGIYKGVSCKASKDSLNKLKGVEGVEPMAWDLGEEARRERGGTALLDSSSLPAMMAEYSLRHEGRGLDYVSKRSGTKQFFEK